ncbi:MAG: hypothetical protein FWD64_11220, partial [Acidobacteriaceae bacterium]|nr:hypothetical protein [Acidobacteriaceae bacterium]
VASARADAAAAAAAAGPAGPLPPPPIDLKFFGVITAADGKQQAFLLKDDNVFKASEGDIVQRRYKIITISASTILVEDMTNNNRQTLPRASAP